MKEKQQATVMMERVKDFWTNKIMTNQSLTREQVGVIYGCVQTITAFVGLLSGTRLDLSIIGLDLPEELKEEWDKICVITKD